MINDYNYYKDKYSRNLKVIDTAKKAYDAVRSARNLNAEENIAALFFAIDMINNDNKNIL